jgi:hypothetical protein
MVRSLGDGRHCPYVLLKDILPGAGFSFPSITALGNGKVVFQATDGAGTKQHGKELW